MFGIRIRKKLTYGQFLDQIEKNGYRQLLHKYIELDDNNKVIGACALGQGMANLGFKSPSDFYAKYNIDWRFKNFILDANDSYNFMIPQIVAEARIRFADILDQVIPWGY